MPFYRKRRGFRRRVFLSRPRRGRARMFSKRVTRVINRLAEPKLIENNYTSTFGTTGAINSITSIYNTSITASVGQWFVMTAIGQGTNYNQRVGFNVHWKAISIKGFITTSTSFATEYINFVRMVVVMDKNNNGASSDSTALGNITPQDIYESTSLGCHLAVDQRKRWKVLIDKQWVFSNEANGGVAVNIYRKFSQRYRGEFRGTGSTGAGQGMIYLLMFSNASTSATNPGCDLTFRVYFNDI